MYLQYIEQKGHERGRAAVESRYLLQLAQDTTPSGRYTLTNAVAKFFEHDELNSMERHLVIEIMMSLIHRAELDLREALAERLSMLPNVPAEVVIFLANDEISVARPVLRNSPVLNDVDLVYIISSKGTDHWQSIAGRAQLNPLVVRRLVDTNDAGTAATLVGNPHIVMHRNTFRRLIRTSLKSEEIQKSLLRRPEVDAELAVDIYACVSLVLRREITKRFRVNLVAVDVALDSLIAELSQEARGILDVTPEMIALARQYRERNELSPVLMIKALRRGQVSFFVALFAERLGMGADVIIRLIKKDSGKSFAAACRAVGMMKTEFASIYLLSRSVRTGEKIVDQDELADALKYFDTIRDFEVQRDQERVGEEPGAVRRSVRTPAGAVHPS